MVLVKVYQGEHSRTANNSLLGQLRISGIPPAPAGMSVIDVRFTYNLDGILDVDVEVLGTGKKHQLVIERNPGQLSRAEVDAARAAMAKLKFHPRESLPNRTALARAEALYVDLRGPAREELGFGIRNLLGALETQDPAAIEQARIALLHMLEIFEKHKPA